MENSKKYILEEVKNLEKKLVEYIVKKIEDFNIDINIIETKVKNQGKFKKYEIHYLEESLSLDPIDQKILYRNNKIGYNIIEISNIYYIKLRISIINRKNYFEMIDKKEM